MSALRRVLRLEIPACIQEHNQPRTSGIGALCQWARLESTGLFVGFDRREVGEVLKLLGIWRGASFACESATGFGKPSKGAPHGDEITCFAAHAGRVDGV